MLYLLIAGDLIFFGLAAVAVGVVAAPWHPRTGRGLVWGGLALAAASAWPFHLAVYSTLMLTVTWWQLSGARGRVSRRGASLLLLVFAASLWAMALPARLPGHLSMPVDRPLYVVGDSLSAGLGASQEGTWPRLLAARRGLRILNLARPGATLASGLAQAQFIPQVPGSVLIELGGNDVLGGTSPEQLASDLGALLSTVVRPNRRVLMFELPLLPLQSEYGRVQRRVCREHSVQLLPRYLLAGAVALPGHASDGLHLSTEGHIWLATRLDSMWR